MARKYNVKITKSGMIYIGITVVLSVAAINTGNNLLYIISSLMLALMALSGMTSLANLLLIDIDIEPPKEIFAGLPAGFKLSIRKKIGSSFFLRCETVFGYIKLPFVKGVTEGSLWLSFPKRGMSQVDNIRIHSGFPLGFFRRYKRCSVGRKVLVYPKPVICALPVPTGGKRGTEKETDFFYGELSDEIKELRQYKESDPLKWVEWKATARKGKMVVREFYRLEGDTLLIDLTGKTGDWEKRVSEASFLVLEGFKRKLQVGLKLPESRINPGEGETHKHKLMEALSLA